MTDMRALLAGLEEYRQSVEQHLEVVHEDFDEVSHYWLALSECFAGNAADEFRPIWEVASQRFREYVERWTAIVRVLGERIDSLRQAERPIELSGQSSGHPPENP
jgi:hypothetical protein